MQDDVVTTQLYDMSDWVTYREGNLYIGVCACGCVMIKGWGLPSHMLLSLLPIHVGRFNFSETNSPGGRVCAMVSTGEVDKRVWIAATFSKSFKVTIATEYCVLKLL